MTNSIYEVQMCIAGHWSNEWHEDDDTQYYNTHDDAMAAIYEFFADLHRSQMAHHYSLDDYRVVLVKDEDEEQDQQTYDDWRQDEIDNVVFDTGAVKQ